MPILESFACLANNAPGFVIPLFCRHPGANLLQIQRLDTIGRVSSFEDIAWDGAPRWPANDQLVIDIGDRAVWAFMDASKIIHVGTKDDFRLLAKKLLSPELIRTSPVSAADLIRFCELEGQMPEETRLAFEEMVNLFPIGAKIWRDTDLILPLVRQQLGSTLDHRTRGKHLLSEIWANTLDDRCHIYCPEELLNEATIDMLHIEGIASAWGIARLELHPVRPSARREQVPVLKWPIIGHGGVGRWTVRRMWNATGPAPHELQSRMNGHALEGLLSVPSATSGEQSQPPSVRIVIHGSSPQDVEAGSHIFTQRSRYALQHLINIRPLGINPERRQFVPARAIANGEDAPDFTWVVANHRQRRFAQHFSGLARSQCASRFARAGVSALADLTRSSRGREILQETSSSRQLGLIGATRFLADLEMHDLLLRLIYSMLSPEWSFSDCKRIVCLWPRALPEQSIEYLRIGRREYPIEMIGLKNSTARADIRCLAFGVQERREGLLGYADYIASVMAAWEWDLRSELGQEMLFEEQGGVISMLVADTPARLDDILRRDRHSGPLVDLVVTNKPPTPSQAACAKLGTWEVIHHVDLPSWLSREYGEPGQWPAPGRMTLAD